METIGTVTYKGLLVVPADKAANVRAKASVKAPLLLHVLKGDNVGISTGQIIETPGEGNWFEVKTEKGTGFVQQKIVKLYKPSEKEANDLVSKLVVSDQKVFETLLRISPIISNLKAKGKNTATYDKQFKALSDRLTKRQQAIKESKVVSWKAGLKKGYDKMISWFKSLYSSISGIGEPVSLTVTITISAVVGAGLAVTAYFLFKPKYSESQTDLKISSELESLLSKTDPETAAQIKTDLETQIDTAYNQGKTDQSFKSAWNIGKYVLIFGAGYFLITKFVTSQNRNK